MPRVLGLFSNVPQFKYLRLAFTRVSPDYYLTANENRSLCMIDHELHLSLRLGLTIQVCHTHCTLTTALDLLLRGCEKPSGVRAKEQNREKNTEWLGRRLLRQTVRASLGRRTRA